MKENTYLKDGVTRAGRMETILKGFGLVASAIPQYVSLAITAIKISINEDAEPKDDSSSSLSKSMVASFTAQYMTYRFISKVLTKKERDATEGRKHEIQEQKQKVFKDITSSLDDLCFEMKNIALYDDNDKVKNTLEKSIKNMERLSNVVAPIPGINWEPGDKITKTIESLKDQLEFNIARTASAPKA